MFESFGIWLPLKDKICRKLKPVKEIWKIVTEGNPWNFQHQYSLCTNDMII